MGEVDACGMYDVIEQLCLHPNKEVCTEAEEIISTYFAMPSDFIDSKGEDQKASN